MREGFEDLQSPRYESDERFLASAQNFVKLLGGHRHASDRLRSLLADVDCEIAAMKLLISNEAKEFSEIREKLVSAEEKIKGWISDQAMAWDSRPELFSECLTSVDEVRLLAEGARSLSSMGKSESDELTRLADGVLQAAMARIEEELRDIFAHGLQSCTSNMPPPPHPPCEEEATDKGSVISDESLTGDSRRESSSTDSESYHYVADLVPPDSVPVVKSIARVMFSVNYDKEFCDAFEACQKEALDELLTDLGINRFTIEELIKTDWRSLDGRIKTWIHAVKTFVQFYLAGEKWLCDQIFEESWPMGPTIFANIASPIMSCFLNFGHGVAMGARRPEKLFRIIDMLDVLTKLFPGMHELFCEEAAARSIKAEVEELAARLGCAAKATFLEFGDFVLSDPSLDPFPAGQIHHLTKYVMNYVNTLPAYKNTLNTLLRIENGSDLVGILNEEEPASDEDFDAVTSCPLAVNLRLIVDKLETNLETKSQLYKDVSLRHIFLLNNAYYIVQKVKNSDLRAYLGDFWIKKRIVLYQQHANSYVRSSWSWTVPLLKDEGGLGPSSTPLKKTNLKEKLRSFASTFEELYKVQTGWCIRDDQLKQELIILIQKMIPAYQSFVRRCKNENLEKYVKYEADDLAELLEDLFEGSVKSLNSTWRR